MRLCLAFLVLASVPALADWHGGTVTGIAFAHEGDKVVFTIAGYTRSDCTCYPTWPTYVCLNRARTNFKEEYAWLLAARARGNSINIYVDEATCNVLAMYESGPP
jgi:hypothetical protein